MALVFVVAAVALGSLAVPAAAQTYTVLHNYSAVGPRNFQYSAAMVQGRDGKLYGTSSQGGTSGLGTVFNISLLGADTTLHSFDGTTGTNTYGGVTLGSDGNFYGTTFFGGSSNLGVIYKITSTGTLTLLHTFTNTGDGGGPNSAPIQGVDGNFYGAVFGSGNAVGSGIFKITPTGVFKTLHSTTPTDGFNSNVMQGSDGSLYGPAASGGLGNGTVFKVSTAGTYKVLHNFTGTDGSFAFGRLVQGTDGNFYGIASQGGTNGNGVIYKITSTGVFTVLHKLDPTTEGFASQAGLIQATDGNLYATTLFGGSLTGGTLFKITTGGVLTVLHTFDSANPANGFNPCTTLTQDTNGLLYGETANGGTGDGVFYSLNIGAAPFAKLALTSGKVGASIGIFGQGFLAATGVTFGGVAGTFTTSGDGYMTATVPAGAKTGPVVVLIPSGNLTSSQTFKVTPAITSFTPGSGPVGTVVTITGSGLTQASKVTFGGVVAPGFTINSDTKVTVTVPTGGKTGKIAITTPGGVSTSAATFTVG